MNNILKNPILYGILGFFLLVYVEEVRIFVLLIVFAVFIAKDAKNGIMAYFAYSSLGAFINVLLSILSEGSNIYSQLEASSSLLTVATMGNIIDIIIYTETSGWNGFENFLAAIFFGVIAFFIQKS